MSIQVGVGFSEKKELLQAVEEAVRLAKINLNNAKANLAFVFTTIEFTQPSVIETISSLLKNTQIIGASSAAVITSHGIFKHGLAVMLVSLPAQAYFNTACVKEVSNKTALGAGELLAEALLQQFKGMRRDFSIIFSDGMIPEGANLIWGLQEKLGTSFPFAGACACDNIRFQKSYVYFNDKVYNDAACGILLGGKINFGLGIEHGWKPLGKPHFINKARGNVVYEIDGFPAVKIYEEYLGTNLNNLKKDLKYISTLYPLGINFSEEQEYLLRNILDIQDDGALILQADAPLNSPVRLMIGTKESCLEATSRALEEAKKNLPAPDFLLVFDSISRYILLGRDAPKELKIIKDGLKKDTPIIGLYTYGEQAPLKATRYRGKAYFHNQTIGILAVGTTDGYI